MDHSQIGLADWLIELKSQLVEAVEAEKERRNCAVKTYVPKLKLEGVTVEMTVASEKKTGGKGEISFWILTTGAEKAKRDIVTQRITLELVPDDEIYLGANSSK